MHRYTKTELYNIGMAFKQFRTHLHDSDYIQMVQTGHYNTEYLKIESFGRDYSGKIVYEIDAYGNNVGFFGEIIFLLYRLYFADAKGFVPYVEWGRNNLYYEDNGIDNEKNVFLYYFKPVSEVKDITKAMNLVKAKESHVKFVQDTLDVHGYDITNEYIESLSGLIAKYLTYNDKTKEYLEQEFEHLLGRKRTLAVHYRGTDYKKQYNNHPVSVSIECIIGKVRTVFENGKYEQIFVATDEKQAIEYFVSEFGEKIKYYKNVYRGNEGDDSVAFSRSNRVNHKYLLGLEVLRDQYTLTRCSGLVGGISNITIVSQLMRKAWYDKYDDLEILNNGINRNDKVFSNAKH